MDDDYKPGLLAHLVGMLLAIALLLSLPYLFYGFCKVFYPEAIHQTQPEVNHE